MKQAKSEVCSLSSKLVEVFLKKMGNQMEEKDGK